jgi:hypothetical protein
MKKAAGPAQRQPDVVAAQLWSVLVAWTRRALIDDEDGMASVTCGEGRSERRRSGERDGEATATTVAHSLEGRKEVTAS